MGGGFFKDPNLKKFWETLCGSFFVNYNNFDVRNSN